MTPESEGFCRTTARSALVRCSPMSLGRVLRPWPSSGHSWLSRPLMTLHRASWGQVEAQEIMVGLGDLQSSRAVAVLLGETIQILVEDIGKPLEEQERQQVILELRGVPSLREWSRPRPTASAPWVLSRERPSARHRGDAASPAPPASKNARYTPLSNAFRRIIGRTMDFSPVFFSVSRMCLVTIRRIRWTSDASSWVLKGA